MTAAPGPQQPDGLFAEPDRRPTPVTRPDGRLYRPRKLPRAYLLSDDYEEVVGVAVLRTHSLGTAEAIGLAELDAYDSAWPWVLTLSRTTWGHWRPDGPDRTTWEADATGRTGTPAIFFDAEQR